MDALVLTGSLDDAGSGPRAAGFAGGAPGISAALEIAGDWTVIALANLDPPSASVLARGARDIIRGRREPEGKGKRSIHHGHGPGTH